MEEEAEETKTEKVRNAVMTNVNKLISFISDDKEMDDIIEKTKETLKEVESISEERMEVVSDLINETEREIEQMEAKKDNLSEALDLIEKSTGEKKGDIEDEIEEVERYISILEVRLQTLNTQKFLVKQYKRMIKNNLKQLEKIEKGGFGKEDVAKMIIVKIILGISSTLFLGFGGAVGYAGALGLPLG